MVQGFLDRASWIRLALAGVLVSLVIFVLAQGGAVRKREITLAARGVPLSAKDPTLDEWGPFTFLGGLALRSADGRFGGLSGLRADCPADDRARLQSISDQGDRIALNVGFVSGRLREASSATVDRLLGLDGRVVVGKAWGDAESLATLPDGRTLVGFERQHRIWIYGPGLEGVAKRLETPPALSRAPTNGGLESLAAWPDGRILAITESLEASSGRVAAFLLESGAWGALEWTPTGPGFEPSDATVSAGGDLLVLERFWSPLAPTSLRSRVVRVQGDTVRRGAVLRGEILGELAAPLITENFEGIAACRTPGGQERLFLVSDDNFNVGQQTLILAFAFR